MTLPVSGTISLNDVNVELGNSPTALIDIGGAEVRTLFGVASGAISMSDGYGKSDIIKLTSSGTLYNLNLFTAFGSPTVAGNYEWTNNGDIRSSTGTWAVLTGTFPVGSTLTIINNGYIRGRGGNGGNDGLTGSAGKIALYMQYPMTLYNAGGYIYGGGGGGGGCVRSGKIPHTTCGGGGGGSNAGAGGIGDTNGSAGTLISGGAGGTYSSGGVDVGGTGGGVGANGGTGISGTGTDPVYAGGAAGRAIFKNGLVLTILSGNDTTHIKGPVS